MILRSRGSTGPSIAASLPLAPGLVSLRSISSSSSSSRGRRSVVEGNELESQREIRSKTRQGKEKAEPRCYTKLGVTWGRTTQADSLPVRVPISL